MIVKISFAVNKRLSNSIMPWFYVQLLHATRCNNCGHSNMLTMPAIIAACCMQKLANGKMRACSLRLVGLGFRV